MTISPRRLATSALACALILPAPLLAAAPAQADVKRQCTGQDKVLIKRVENVRKKFVATHVRAITLARGSGWSQTTEVAHSKTLRASSTITAEVGGSAKWGFASIETKLSTSVAAEGEKTESTTVTEFFEIPPVGKRDRRFALFTGNFEVKGRWHYLSCSRSPGRGIEKYGAIRSFTGYDSGTVLCPRSRYKTGSYRFKIARQAGC